MKSLNVPSSRLYSARTESSGAASVKCKAIISEAQKYSFY